MNKTVNKPGVKLNYTGHYFAEEDFCVFQSSGEWVLTFYFKKKTHEERSIFYYFWNEDKTDAFMQKGYDSEGHCKYRRCYLFEKGYILVEKGVKGFDFEIKVFNYNVAENGDGYTVDITESRDESLCEELTDAFSADNFLSAQVFNERVGAAVKYEKGRSEEEALEGLMKKIKDTPFLDTRSDCDIYRYWRLDNFHWTNKLLVQLKNGPFIPYKDNCLSDERLRDMDFILFTQNKDSKDGLVLKPVELLHDVDCRFWLKTQTLHRYPQDGGSIRADYPDLYELLTHKDEVWREITETADKAPEAYRLGDSQIAVPCSKCKDRWGVGRETFQFAFHEDMLFGEFGPNERLINAHDFAAAYVSYEGRDYFAVYKYAKKERFKKEVYAFFDFVQFISVGDLMSRNCDSMHKTLKRAYNYKIWRGDLMATPIDAQTFDALDERSASL